METSYVEGGLYVCMETRAIFQLIYIDKYKEDKYSIPVEEQIVYFCNPSADSEQALIRIPGMGFRAFDMVDRDKPEFILPNDEYDEAQNEARLWVKTFRFYNRIFSTKIKNLDCMAIDYAVMQDLVQPCAVLKDVIESIQYFNTTASWRSFRKAQKATQIDILNRVKWFQEYQGFIRACLRTEPKVIIPPYKKTTRV